MANNRMLLICNVCVPPGTEWPKYSDPALLHIAKWYPCDAYYSPGSDKLGAAIVDFLELHKHAEIHPACEENPVRLEYEIWVRDMPAIKKWEG